MQRSVEKKGFTVKELQKSLDNQNEDSIQLNLFADRIISMLSTLKTLNKTEAFRRMWRFLLFVVAPANVANGQRNPSKSWLLNRLKCSIGGHDTRMKLSNVIEVMFI